RGAVRLFRWKVNFVRGRFGVFQPDMNYRPVERKPLTADGLSIEVCPLAALEGHRRRAVYLWPATRAERFAHVCTSRNRPSLSKNFRFDARYRDIHSCPPRPAQYLVRGFVSHSDIANGVAASLG